MSPDVTSMMEQMQNGTSGGSTGPGAGQSDGNRASSGSLPGMPGLPGASGPTAAPRPARPLGSPQQEVKYFAGDLAQGILSHIPAPIREILNISPNDTPQDASRKQQMLKNFEGLQAEQQNVVHQKMAQFERQKRQEEEMKAEQQKRAAQQSQDVVAPAGKVSGAGAGEAGKQKNSRTATQNMMSKNRKTLTGAG